MGNWVNDYLEKIEKYLRPLPAGERMDIAAEIKSEIMELQAASKTPEEILNRLGTPEELAKGYLGGAILKDPAFTFRKLGAILAFYSLAGAAWLFVLPVTSVLGVSFMFSGVAAAVAGIIQFAAHLLGIELPWVCMQWGDYALPPELALPCAIAIGALLFLAGRLCWGLTLKIIGKLSSARAKIQN